MNKRFYFFSSWPSQEDETGSMKEIEAPERRTKYSPNGNAAPLETFSYNFTIQILIHINSHHRTFMLPKVVSEEDTLIFNFKLSNFIIKGPISPLPLIFLKILNMIECREKTIQNKTKQKQTTQYSS